MKTFFKRFLLSFTLLLLGAMIPGREAEAADYLTFTATENNSSIKFLYATGTVQVSINGAAFTAYNGSEIKLNKGGNVRFSGKNVTTNDSYHFTMRGGFNASGSVTSLTDGTGDNKNVTLTANCYYSMFNECSALYTAPKLPATKLATGCYKGMFWGTSLTEAPVLPATILADDCYYMMFCHCRSLITAPALPATTLASRCYYGMFAECTSLKKAPALPATTLAPSCYETMFCHCIGLREAPALPATTLADYCYSGMFIDCEDLLVSTSASSEIADPFVLPATNKTDCFHWMFENVGGIPGTPQSKVTYYKYTGYDITYVLNGGINNFYNHEKYAFGSATQLEAPTRENYTFDGWYEDAAFTKKIESIPKTRRGNITLYAKWKPAVYKISYVTNGGTNASENPTVYTYGAGITKFGTPARDGYTFGGWFTDAAFTQGIVSLSSTSKGDVTLYAKWSPNVYRISYELNGGTVSNGNPSQYTFGVGVSGFNQPTKAGYTFGGWYLDSVFTQTQQVASVSTGYKGDITLYVKWIKIEPTATPTKSPVKPATPTKSPVKPATPTKSPDKPASTPTKNPEKKTYTKKIKQQNSSYEVTLDSNKKVTGVKLTSYSNKKATAATVATIKYNGTQVKVTEISDNAFANNKKLKSVTITDSVRTIGKSAFSGCSSLKTVKLGNNVKKIKDKAFYKCTALTTVTGGKNVTSVGESAFFGCKNLKNITLSTKLTTIGTTAFANCKALNKVTLNSKVAFVGAKAFKGCTALKTVTIKTTKLTTKNVGKEAFGGINSKATVKVPKNKLSAYKKLLKKVGVTKKTQKIKK